MPTVKRQNTPGAYRRKLAIQKPGTADDGYGHTQAAWADVVNPIWGSVTSYKGLVSQMADQVLAQEIDTIELRYRPGVDKTMTVLDLNSSPQKRYRIMAINDVESRHEKLALTVVEYA